MEQINWLRSLVNMTAEFGEKEGVRSDAQIFKDPEEC